MQTEANVHPASDVPERTALSSHMPPALEASTRAFAEECTALGKRIGSLEVREQVHEWAIKHAQELSTASLRELVAIIRLKPNELQLLAEQSARAL